MTFTDIETNKKFKLLGGPLNMFETTDIYEKLNEKLFNGLYNAYNLMKQDYCHIDPVQPVVPFTHTY